VKTGAVVIFGNISRAYGTYFASYPSCNSSRKAIHMDKKLVTIVVNGTDHEWPKDTRSKIASKRDDLAQPASLPCLHIVPATGEGS
jgi:hypothetical protein